MEKHVILFHTALFLLKFLFSAEFWLDTNVGILWGSLKYNIYPAKRTSFFRSA